MNFRPTVRFAEVCVLCALSSCNPDNLEPNIPPGANAPQVPVQTLSTSGDTLTAMADALLKTQAKNLNTGTSTTIPVKITVGQDDTTRAIVKFDQAAIAAAVGSGTLTSASLELQVKESGTDAAGNDIDVHRVLKPWTEAGVTWKCGEDLNTANVGADCPTTKWKMSGAEMDAFVVTRTARAHLNAGQAGVAQFDVTGDVQAFLGGTGNHGWLVNTASASSRVLLWSHEAAMKPKLVLSLAQTVVASLPPDSIPAWFDHDSSYASSQVEGRFLRGVVRVLFTEGASQAQREAAVNSVEGEVIGGAPGVDHDGDYFLKVMDDGTGAQLHTALTSLRQVPQVEDADLVGPGGGQMYVRPNDGAGWTRADWQVLPDSARGDNWNMEAIAAPLAWGCIIGDRRTPVAVLDHGFDDFQLENNVTVGRGTLDQYPNSDQHGTAVAGLIAAEGGDNVATTGVMWEAGLHLVDFHRDSIVPWSAMAATIAAVAQFTEARVINLSYGMPFTGSTAGDSAEVRRGIRAFMGTLRRLARRNLMPLLVVPSGDDPQDAWWGVLPALRDSFPGSVLVVGGIARRFQRAAQSGLGRLIDVYAPSELVTTLDGHGGTSTQSVGTSFAAPMAAGVAGLALSNDPSLTPAELKTLIVSGAVRGKHLVPRGGTASDSAPVLNAYETLKLVAQRPGTPLCGNRTYLNGPTFYTQRTSGPEPLGTLDADTYSNFFGYGAFTGSIAVQHGGKSVLVCVGTSYCGEYLSFQNGAWTTTQTPPGEERVSDSGPRNSILGLTHDGDSTATVTQTGTGSYAGVYEIRMVSVSTGQGRDVGTVTSARTYNFGMDVSVAPGGDFLLLMGQWGEPIPAPDNWAMHADLYLMPLGTGVEASRLRTWSNTALLGAQIAEDGREAVLVVNGASTCEYEYISLPGGGTAQTVPSPISYCDRHESRATFLRAPLSSSLR